MIAPDGKAEEASASTYDLVATCEDDVGSEVSKLPLESLETIEFAVFELVAVVAELDTLPGDVIVKSLESEIDPARLSLVIDPF